MNEREYLRDLAKKQLEIASLPVMEERRKKWYRLNDGATAEPLVSVEFNGLPEQFFPPAVCETPFARELETQFNKLLKYHELNDDRVIPAYFSIPVMNGFIPFGIKVGYSNRIQQSMGYAYDHPVKDLEQDFHKLGKSVYTVDDGLKNSTNRKAEIDEVFGDILPVKIEFPSFNISLGNIFCSFMGMETMFLAMYDYPALFHRAMTMVTNDYMEYMDALEKAGAILPNGDGSHLGQGSFGYTNDLRSAGDIKDGVAFSDCWGYGNFQETVRTNPEMFDEFFFSYMEKITERFGLYSYGCCEPVHELWDLCLSRLTNLRKLSISAWCDEESIADNIRGRKIVYHRKPSANFISSDVIFNEEAFSAHIAKSVKTAKGCPLEVTFREELTLMNEPWRLKRAVELTREQFAKHWQG